MDGDKIVFPKILKIHLIDKDTHKKLSIKDVVIYVHLFARRKNDYHLGPFLSNSDGKWEISKEWLEISADGELQSGLMDYFPYSNCKPEAVIKLPSSEEVKKAIEARNLWGILGREDKIYGSKEELINKLYSNNNDRIKPVIQNITLDGKIDLLEVSLPTSIS